MTTGVTVVVSGGAAGIGAATVDLLVAQNHRCIVLDRDPDPRVHPPASVHHIRCDVSDSVATEKAIAEGAEWAPQIRCLVNCAGFSQAAPSIDLDEAEWRHILATNLDGALFTSLSVGRRMIAGGGGSIVNLGSVAGQFGWPQRLAYSCAKGALESLTRTLAVEWAEHNIRVNTVVPSHVDTPLQRRLISSGVVNPEQVNAMNPLHRMADASEIASVIVFILGEGASFITGQTVNVDGGFNIFKLPAPRPKD